MIRFGAKARLFEEFLYTQVHAEVHAGAIRPGLWAKAEADAMGDESKTKAIYLKLRVQSLRDEASVIAEFERRASKETPSPHYTIPAPAPEPDYREGADEKREFKENFVIVIVLAVSFFFLFFVATQ